MYSYMETKPDPKPPTYCDPLAVLVLFRPDVVVRGLGARVKIETKGARTRGISLVDYFSPESSNHNAYLVLESCADIILE